MHVDDILNHVDHFESPDPPCFDSSVMSQQEIQSKLEAAKSRIESMYSLVYEEDESGILDAVDRSIEQMLLGGVYDSTILSTRFEVSKILSL